jgi:hypothetical protein
MTILISSGQNGSFPICLHLTETEDKDGRRIVDGGWIVNGK